VVSEFPLYVLSFRHKNAYDGQTDIRTDGQNYDPQDRAILAASRGKSMVQTSEIFKAVRLGAKYAMFWPDPLTLNPLRRETYVRNDKSAKK